MFWYEDEVKLLEKKESKKFEEKKRLVFYGSSTFHYWDNIEEAFPEFDVVNQSFGGSTLAACAWFFKRLIPPQNPDILMIYAGDNDLGDNRHPEEVYFYFKALMALLEEHCPDTVSAFVSIKPSPARMHLFNSIKFANKIIKAEIDEKYPKCFFIDLFDDMLKDSVPNQELYQPEGLHLSAVGYDLWKCILHEKYLDG